MKLATLVVSPFYQSNKIFDLNDTHVNRDDCIFPFYKLKEEFAQRGINLSTQDINKPEESEIIIYNEMPAILPQKTEIEKSYLLIFESEIIRPDNWDLSKHRHFNKIFTWNDDYVDEIKYFKMNFSQKIPDKCMQSKKEKLCTVIAGNKTNRDSRQLYSERLNAIEWFEVHHPEDFDLYGMGWDNLFQSKPFNVLNRFENCKRLAKKRRPSYKGTVSSKNETFSEYRFAICYENAKDITGYITEKIFDCFFAGCVPIYWGAPNVLDFIPGNCFIDRRQFQSLDEMYSYISQMNQRDYSEYLKSINEFLKSEMIVKFSAEYFAKRIADVIYGIK